MILLECPNCGARNVSEFGYGGELNKRPGPDPSAAAWAAYLYMRDNPLGNLREWWYHRAGCEQWFIAERHTKTHEVTKTYFWTTS
jgi:sarcosine oxidase subunit delta